jgi:TonB family protein
MKTLLAFCLCLAVLPDRGLAAQQPPRDTPPPSIENARRERDLRATIASGAATRETYLELAAILTAQNRVPDAIGMMKAAAALEPASAEAQQLLGSYIVQYVRGDAADPGRLSFLTQALEAENRALAIRPDYLDALVYKGLVLRMQAKATADPLEQKRMVDEADALRTRALALQRDAAAQPQRLPPGGASSRAPFAGFTEPFEQAMARIRPLRVGGNVRAPIKVKDVKPFYPADAQAAHVQGVVILEALLDDAGKVANARVLRSIPLLDDAALEAVSQWEFTPTELNGQAVGVIMTVTVNFTMMQAPAGDPDDRRVRR